MLIMETTGLSKYLESIIHDDHAMEVLYYSMKKAIAENNYSLKGIIFIKISKKFCLEEPTIYFNKRFSTKLEAFAVLLSIKALMLNKEWIKFCTDDELIFKPKSNKQFDWLEYTYLIIKCMSDNEFCSLYYTLLYIYDNNDLSEDDKTEFVKYMKIPEYKNIRNYYQEEASSNTIKNNDVICNNAFVCDDSIIEYNIPDTIEYIGDTAFSYCINLTTLIFNNRHTLFGKFPIIECNNLSQIIVPDGSKTYYKNALPHYKNIIFNEKDIVSHKESKSALETKKKLQPTDELKSNIHIKSIDTDTLRHVFDKKATSYKYFWLYAIISLVKEKENAIISFEDLLIRMVSIAWPLIFIQNLNLGSRDMLHSYLNKVKENSALSSEDTKEIIEEYLKTNYNKNTVYKNLTPLLKNVPYRFLSPWIKYTTNESIIEKSHNKEFKALYAINDNNIAINEDWFDYIINNYDDILMFVKSELTIYIKKYNTKTIVIPFNE